MSHHDVNWVIEVVSGLLAASWSIGECKRIEDFLRALKEFEMLSGEEQREALISVIHTEIELRRKSGQSPASAEYADRFPIVGRAIIDQVICLPALPTE